MNSAVSIRRCKDASEEQCAALAALHRTGPDRPWSSTAFRALCIEATSRLYLAEEQAETALPLPAAIRPEALHGFLLMRALPPEADILTIVVAPALRGRGIGTALLLHAKTALQAEGVTDWWLEVAVDNTAAQALYHKAGFTPHSQRLGYYRRTDGRQVDAAIWKCSL